MKKLIAFIFGLSAIVSAAFLVPVPAKACADNVCALRNCSTYGATGFDARTYAGFTAQLQEELCTNPLGSTLYIYCKNYKCTDGALANGTLFTVNGSMVLAFNFKDEKESDTIINSIKTNGINVALKQYAARSMSFNEFNDYASQLKNTCGK